MNDKVYLRSIAENFFYVYRANLDDLANLLNLPHISSILHNVLFLTRVSKTRVLYIYIYIYIFFLDKKHPRN